MPQDTGFTIRPATDEDVPRLLALIQDLAVYEKLTHEVVATEETLRASLFGDSPAAEALLAFADDEPAGFAVYFHTFSTFLARRGMYLHDLYVSPKYRRRGLGTRLLRRVAAIAVEPRKPQTTPNEYASLVAKKFPENRGETDLITEAFVKSRYGSKESPHQEEELVETAWSGIRKTLAVGVVKRIFSLMRG